GGRFHESPVCGKSGGGVRAARAQTGTVAARRRTGNESFGDRLSHAAGGRLRPALADSGGRGGSVRSCDRRERARALAGRTFTRGAAGEIPHAQRLADGGPSRRVDRAGLSGED